jgi:hypothetical protein
MKNLFILLLLVVGLSAAAQVAINKDGSAADNSAMLDVKSTDKGLLPPRMTAEQIGAIQYPANGLIVFCTSDNKLYTFVSSGQQWKEIAYGTGIILPPAFICGSSITINHVAGDVAPVHKTVTYGTVTNIPGEPSKCWITSNLGADHQANSVEMLLKPQPVGIGSLTGSRGINMMVLSGHLTQLG